MCVAVGAWGWGEGGGGWMNLGTLLGWFLRHQNQRCGCCQSHCLTTGESRFLMGVVGVVVGVGRWGKIGGIEGRDRGGDW